MNRGIKICLLALFLIGTSLTQAQRKSIVIRKDLAANSDVFKVKFGTQWMGKIWKFKFGDYAVVKSKMGWNVTTGKANLLNTKTESKTENKFSFVLSNKTSDSAIVNAMSNVLVKELQAFKLFSSKHYEFYVGEDELLIDANTFSSLITTTSNQNDIWVLTLEQTVGSDIDNKHEGI
ncbi:MAG: hypothetical protein KJN66_08795, partial [Bacteroidia bacterium]|nr:hypothetical protein [Bacteroidia bacterium]